MSRNSKILLGIISFLPIVTTIAYMISFFSFFLRFIPSMQGHQDELPGEFMHYFIIIFISAVVMGLISLGLLVYFLIHAINNPAVHKDERLMWILLFIFLSMISMPIYWYMRIWTVPVQPAT
jgi:uncharacterized membrane protein